MQILLIKSILYGIKYVSLQSSWHDNSEVEGDVLVVHLSRDDRAVQVHSWQRFQTENQKED